MTTEFGHGSTFSVELASADDAANANGDRFPSVEEIAGAPMTANARTVLYVEDNLRT